VAIHRSGSHACLPRAPVQTDARADLVKAFFAISSMRGAGLGTLATI
jgi:hypothetical protein